MGITTIAEAVNYFGLGLSFQANGGQEGSASLAARGVAVGTDAGKHILHPSSDANANSPTPSMNMRRRP